MPKEVKGSLYDTRQGTFLQKKVQIHVIVQLNILDFSESFWIKIRKAKVVILKLQIL